MAALYLLVVEDSKLDVEASEITDAGLLGVNGSLDGVALSLDDGVAGTGGMVQGLSYNGGLVVAVRGVGLPLRW